MSTPNDTTCSIYRIVCFETGKCYVGQTINPNDRWLRHLYELKHDRHHSFLLQLAYNKYGKLAFYFEIIENNIDINEVNKREIYWIDQLNSYRDGYNLNIGGSDRVNLGRKCIWNGVEYDSVKAAADANGVKKGTMWNRIKQGLTCDADIGTSRGRARKIPVEWNGVIYPSAIECEQATGIKQGTIYYRARRGTIRDSDVQPTGGLNAGKASRKMCVWNGIEYYSITEAAKAIGVDISTLSFRLKSGHVNDESVLLARNTPCTYNGVYYTSVTDAAKANGVRRMTMFSRIRRGYTCDAEIPDNPNRKRTKSN